MGIMSGPLSQRRPRKIREKLLRRGIFCAALLCLGLQGTGSVKAAAAEEGETLVIWAPDRELRDLMKLYLPSYYEDEEQASYGEFTVRWVIAPSEDGLYQDRLDAQLPVNADAAQETRIDFFVLRKEDTVKYLSSSLTEDLTEGLGLKETEFSQHFPYLSEREKNRSGQWKGAAVFMEPGVLTCRAALAEAVLGSSDPETLEEYTTDWTALAEIGEAAAAQKIALFSEPEELYAMFVPETGWVDDDSAEHPVLTIPQEYRAWAELSAAWKAQGFFSGEETEEVLFAVGADVSEASSGTGRLMLAGPACWCEDLLMLACAEDTDNPETVREIFRLLTVDETTLTAMSAGSGLITNTVNGMRQTAEGYASLVYQGQNTLQKQTELCLGISEENAAESLYDRPLNALYCEAMMAYIDGESSLEEAENQFFENAIACFPELTE